MIPLMLGMAGASMLMQNEQNRQTRRMNKEAANAAAAQTEFSPWTGHGKGQFTPTAEKSLMGAGMQGAASGASFAQSFDQAQQQKDLAQSHIDMNNAQANQLYTQQMSKPYNQGSPWTYDERRRMA